MAPADDGQQFVSKLCHQDLVLISEVAVNTQRTTRGCQQLLDLVEEVLSTTNVKTQ